MLLSVHAGRFNLGGYPPVREAQPLPRLATRRPENRTADHHSRQPVVALTGIPADGLKPGVTTLGPLRGLALIESLPGSETCIVPLSARGEQERLKIVWMGSDYRTTVTVAVASRSAVDLPRPRSTMRK